MVSLIEIHPVNEGKILKYLMKKKYNNKIRKASGAVLWLIL